MKQSKATYKDANVTNNARKRNKFDTYTAREAGAKSKRKKKAEKIVDDKIENYIKGTDFTHDWDELKPFERVQLALDYSIRLKKIMYE